MPSCAIINCKNNTSCNKHDTERISFHAFPKDPYIKEKWINATGCKNWFPNQNSVICSVHFSVDSFHDSRKRLLKKTAYPTIDILKAVTISDENSDMAPVKCCYHNCSNTNLTKSMFSFPVNRKAMLPLWIKHSEPEPKEDSDPEDLEEELKCNNCKGEIKCFRYVCVQCVQYDVCGSCYDTDLHAHHYILRIPALRSNEEMRAVIEGVRQVVSATNLGNVTIEQEVEMPGEYVEVKIEKDPLFESSLLYKIPMNDSKMLSSDDTNNMLSKSSRELSKGTKELSKGTRELSTNIQELSKGAKELSTDTRESSRSSRELSTDTDELSNVSKQWIIYVKGSKVLTEKSTCTPGTSSGIGLKNDVRNVEPEKKIDSHAEESEPIEPISGIVKPITKTYSKHHKTVSKTCKEDIASESVSRPKNANVLSISSTQPTKKFKRTEMPVTTTASSVSKSSTGDKT